MPTSSSRLSYPDCEAFMNRALEDEVGVRTFFLTKGQAFQFRVRCHSFRDICRKDNKQVYQLGDPLYGRCEYDPITLSILCTDDPPKAESEWFVYARKCQINEGDIESLAELEGNANANT